MAQPASMGVFAKFATEPGSAPYTYDSSSEPWAFSSENLLKQDSLWNPNVIRGSRSACATRTRLGPHAVFGPIYMPISPLMLATWCERAFGGTISGGIIGLAETLPSFGCLFSRDAKTFDYTGCQVDKLVLRGRRGGPNKEPFIEGVLHIVGVDENVGTSYPGLTLDCSSLAWQDFVFSDMTFNILSANRNVIDFLLVLDNHLQVRYTNSLSPTSIRPSDRDVLLRMTTPYTSDEFDLYQQAVAGNAGTLTLTNASVSAAFAFDRLQCTAKSPVASGKGEIVLYTEYQSRKASNDECKITLDVTP